jgi:pyruvate dehydrogenase E2 component (dihydrolipoyllysine-residue acetyltransferase)
LSGEGARGEVRVQEPSAAERAVARRAAESRATVPVLELSVELGRATATAELVQACAHALREHPRANAAYRDGRFELYSRINVGVLVASGEQYAIPTVFDADRKSHAELEDELATLLARARDGELPGSAYTGATFTVWNAAELGLSTAGIPVVPPQAAAIAAGARALTLCCDHRILYGAGAAGFLQAIAHHLDRDRI